MTTIKFFAVTLAAASAALVAGPKAEAGPITYAASSAVSDSLHSGSDSHSLWLPFFENAAGTPLLGDSDGSDFDFLTDSTLTVAYGSATLQGRVVSQVDPSYALDVVFNFQQQNGPGMTGPKLELRNNAYVDNGGPIDPTSWDFFSLTGGSITGTGALEGLSFEVQERGMKPFPFQLGTGANGKNGNLGASVWYSLVTDADCTSTLCTDFAGLSLTGDINIDLSEVPVPGAALLFITGIAGLGVTRRRKTS